MSTRDINTLRDELLKNRIELSDTISQFMEKCNNNFSAIIEWGGGPAGEEGDDGKQGVPTKPKVPIHIWREGTEYKSETTTNNPDVPFEIREWYEDLSDPKYQDGHLIMLKNGRVYILEVDNYTFNLKPKYIISLSTYNTSDIIDGKNAYVHIAYANAPNSTDGFITDQQLRNEYVEEPAVATFNLRRNANNSDYIIEDRPYMGIYSDNTESSSTEPSRYTWIRIQGGIGLPGEKGEPGPVGPAGPQGDPGDGYTGKSYTIDLEGDMSTISIDIDRTRLYDNSEDYCECTLHSYYGDENVRVNVGEVSIKLPEEYKYSGNTIVLKSNENSKVGKIEKLQKGNDVNIKFTPDETFVFPKKTIIFSIHVETSISDDNDGKTYEFVRDSVWMIKGIVSTFELEILPQYHSIKLFEDGEYYPKKLLVSVYKVEDAERTIFNFEENPNFKLLYKNYNSNTWIEYPTDGVDTEGVSCLEFKVVRYYNTPEEEIWDYEDVWVVADGKGTHYYHADLGSTESMMVLTTGEKINIGTEDEPKYCAELRNESGYSITFEPKFYDGTEELEIENVSIGTNSGDEYYANGTFVRELKKDVVDGIAKYTLTVSKVPYDIEMIPMSIDVRAKCPIYDNNGNFVEDDHKSDSVSFNVYISTLSNTYTLVPTVSTYNTSTGKTGDTIGCNVYKNNTIIPTDELDRNALKLEYAVHDGGTDEANLITYTEPLVYGDDDDIEEDEFTAKDVAIEFILSYRNKEIVRSIVPLVKDGIDGRDGDSWQYIFCRSPKYPFGETGISDPSTWVDDKPKDSNNELLGNNGVADSDWYDDHKGVSAEYRYEYQSYRKWDKDNKCWGKYGSPTLYSNYSESGSGYSVMLSNPIAVIPVGDGENDWSVDENNANQSDSTLVYLFNNVSDISNNTKVSISLPPDNEYVKKGNFTKDKENNVNKVIFKPVVGDSIFDFGTNAQYKLPITLTYSLGEDIDNDGVIDEFTSTINWTLSPIKGLYDVEVFVNKRVVNTSTSNIHYLQVGYYLISSNKTKKFIENYNVDNTNGYKIILTDDIGNLSSNNVVSNWQNATYNFVINGKNRNCYVVLVESDGKTIIDYTNVEAINDGASAIHLELDQDYISLPCSVDGNAVHPDYDVNKHPIYSRMRLYNGDKLIEDYDQITYSFSDASNGLSLTGFHMDGEGGFDVPKDIITGDMNILCTAEYNGSSFHKTLFIDLEITPYELELSKSILTRDGDSKKIKDDKLIVRVKYWSGVDSKWVYTGDGVVKASTSKRQENLYFGNASGDLKERTLIISNSTLANNTTDTEVKISYYKDENSTDIISYENIGIISDGETGSAPSCTSTKILGYSLAELDINSSNWKASLNELGDTTPGQPIYILNEYGWSDGTKTKGITVTLAGTQGVAGKSRVLFYLGSFYDGTLSGTSVQGTLDDERCDYYIDKSNKAWMRTGTAKTATGSSSGNTNDPNWKESTKVGFLQAGAIHANMINAGTISSNQALITELFAQEVTAKNLTVSGANVDGELEGNTISSQDFAAEGTPAYGGKKWILKNDGSGHLASGNISWTQDGNVTFGSDVKLSWATIQGKYKIVCNVPYLRTITENGTTLLDYKNKNHDKLLGDINGYYWYDDAKTTTIGTIIKDDTGKYDQTTKDYCNSIYYSNKPLYHVYIYEYNENTNEWDIPTSEQLTLIDKYSFTDDKDDEIGGKITYEGSNSYYQLRYNYDAATNTDAYKQSHRLYPNLKNIKIWIDSYPNCYVEIPVIGADEEWKDNYGLTEDDVVGIIGKTDIRANQITTGLIQANQIDVGTLKITNANISGQLDANKIKVEDIRITTAQITGSLTTDILETNPDKIHISNNYIHCINNDGKKNLIISSNELDVDFIDAILATNNDEQYSVSPSTITTCKCTNSGNGTFVDTGTSSISYSYTNADEWKFNLGKIKEIGYMFKGASLSLSANLQGVQTTSENYNSQQANVSAAADWLINDNFYIDLYKYNNSTNTWDLISTKYIAPKSGSFNQSNWMDAVKPYQSTTNGTAKYKIMKSGLSFDITSNGKYGIVSRFPAHAICSKTVSTVQSLLLQYSIKISNNDAPSHTYTEIGKNGIVTYDGTNSFRLTENGIEMRSNIPESNNFYGIRITNQGMYYCNGENKWVVWNPSPTA